MTRIIIEHHVKDFDAWLAHFRAHAPTRERFGGKGGTVHRNEDDPNDLILVLPWESPERFDAFMRESDVRQVMQRAGVVDEPRITVVSDPVPWDR
ncbi:MAG TPA: hypothetical protein VM889_03930 [Candidatus Thermoplasmatota archaeon]|nr:hypothetical protein [Candidatus Thermoplasmatota archaeon]